MNAVHGAPLDTATKCKSRWKQHGAGKPRAPAAGTAALCGAGVLACGFWQRPAATFNSSVEMQQFAAHKPLPGGSGLMCFNKRNGRGIKGARCINYEQLATFASGQKTGFNRRASRRRIKAAIYARPHGQFDFCICCFHEWGNGGVRCASVGRFAAGETSSCDRSRAYHGFDCALLVCGSSRLIFPKASRLGRQYDWLWSVSMSLGSSFGDGNRTLFFPKSFSKRANGAPQK